MSTIAANSGSRAKGLIGATRLESRRIIVACATAIALAGIAGSVLVATSDHLVDPVAWGLEIAVIAVGTAAIAVFWAAARPGNRIATVLLAYAAAVAGNSLQGATDPLLHSVGVLFEVPAFLLGYYLVFIFPGGRLSGALEKVLLVGIAGAVLASEVPWFFFSPVVAGGAPLAGCKPNCPTNALMIADKPSIAEGLGTVMNLFSVLVAVAIVCWLSYRIAEATRPRRRALLPV